MEVPAIVSREVWEKAQERRKRNKTMAKRNTKHQYLIAKRVTCGQCGAKMVGKAVSGGKYRYYYCPGSWGMLAEKDCDTLLFRADHIDAAVWEKVREWLKYPEALRQSLEEVRAELERESKPLRDHLSMTDDLLADKRQRQERVVDLYKAGGLSKEDVTDRLHRLETEITALEKEQAALVITLESQTLSDEQIATIERFAQEIAGGLEEANRDFEARRHIIEGMDVQVKLTIEDGLKIARVRWLVEGEEERLSIELTNSRNWSRGRHVVKECQADE